MTPEKIELVKSSWSRLVPVSEQAAALFYGRLFELAPELKQLFQSDMEEQGLKLMTMINTAVNSLDKLETIVPAVQDMGRRHVDYGVKDEDYDTVGAALIWTLEHGLGDTFTDDVKGAWLETYTLIATTMKDAAAQAA